MARHSPKVKCRREGSSRRWSAKDHGRKLAAILAFGQVGIAVLIMLGAGLGLAFLKAQVHAAPYFNRPPMIEWIDVPDGLRETMADKLAPFEAASGYDPAICGKIGQALESDPWIKWVKSVRRTHNLRVLVSCAYRLPAALVQMDGEFYLVDDERVRLPGVYGYQETLPLIQGVGSDPPAPGEVWDAADLAAGLALGRLIEREPFAHQITGIQVHNYGGRHSPRDAHMVLATDRAGSIVKWGSAPGEEIEENNARQKIAILRHNFERFGRADAGFRAIDVSVHPDRFIAEG